MKNCSLIQILPFLQTLRLTAGHQDKRCAKNINPSSFFHYGRLGFVFVACSFASGLLLSFAELFFWNNSLNESKSSVIIKLTPVCTTCPSTTVLYWFTL